MKFNSQNEPADFVSINEFERARGVKLPQVYKEFLIEINGGQLNPSLSYMKAPNGGALEVQELFGLTLSEDHSIAADRFSNFADFVHNRMLHIGYNPFGEIIVMDLRDGSHGQIYFRSHNGAPKNMVLIEDSGFEDAGDYEEASHYFPLANNWSEFVSMLGPAPQLEE